MSAMYHVLPSGETFTSCGIAIGFGRCSWATTRCALGVDLEEVAGELAADDEIAAVGGEVGVVDAGAVAPAATCRIAIVCGSRNTISWSASAITIA